MKRIAFILGLVILLFSSFKNAKQDGGTALCKAYFPLEKGTELTFENYNAKDKLQGIDYMSVTDIIETNDLLRVLVHIGSTDKKGKEVYENDFEYTCEGGIFRISLDNMLPADMLSGMEGMEVELTQSELQMPNNMQVGQKLPDAQMILVASMNGTEIMRMTFDITDRIVEAQESITTPAGTFDCLKLSQKTNTKMMFIEQTFKTIDWVAVNIGSVRSENYSEDGKLDSYRVLSNIKRQ